jgi:hypothetical protein
LREEDIAPAALALAARVIEASSGSVGGDVGGDVGGSAGDHLVFECRAANSFTFAHKLRGEAFEAGPALAALVVLAARVAHEDTIQLVAQALDAEDNLTYTWWSKDVEAVLGPVARDGTAMVRGKLFKPRPWGEAGSEATGSEPAVVVVGEKGRGAGCWACGTTQIEAAMQMTSCLLFKALGICGGDDRMRLDITPVVLPLQALKEKLRSSQLQFVIRVSDEHSVLSALQTGKLAPTCMIADGEFLLTAALERRWQTVVDCILTDFAAVIEGSYSGSCGGSKACTQALCCLRGTIAWCLAANVLPEPYLVARMLGLCAVSPEIVQQLLRQAAATPGPCALKVVIFQQFQTPQLTLRAQESSCVVEAEAVEAAKAEPATVTSQTRTP